MGDLEDAIREHLELKRRRGADPAEVAREEHDALAPVTRSHPVVVSPPPPFAEHDAHEYDAVTAAANGVAPHDRTEIVHEEEIDADATQEFRVEHDWLAEDDADSDAAR